MNLVVDIGNTNVKLHLFEKDKKTYNDSLNEENLLSSLKLLSSKNSIQNVIVSSVTKSYKLEILEIFKSSKFHDLSNDKLKLPFFNSYKDKNSLGQDRIGLVSSAVVQFKNQNNLIIDLGTCITYDFIDFEGIYHGGAISPGINTRYKKS